MVQDYRKQEIVCQYVNDHDVSATTAITLPQMIVTVRQSPKRLLSTVQPHRVQNEFYSSPLPPLGFIILQ